ncbi:hypothetical protein HQ533_06115 [Candidatus Woesearchaeota archaeon]|nr:hypothetical protein [Candidatus Woesearchaeota archaeon]
MTDKLAKIVGRGSYFLLGAACSGFILTMTWISNENNINAAKISEGFAHPNNLEISYENIDEQGLDETLLTHNDQSYLIKIDSIGKPYIQAYEVLPKQIIKKD